MTFLYYRDTSRYKTCIKGEKKLFGRAKQSFKKKRYKKDVNKKLCSCVHLGIHPITY